MSACKNDNCNRQTKYKLRHPLKMSKLLLATNSKCSWYSTYNFYICKLPHRQSQIGATKRTLKIPAQRMRSKDTSHVHIPKSHMCRGSCSTLRIIRQRPMSRWASLFLLVHAGDKRIQNISSDDTLLTVLHVFDIQC